MPRRLETGSRDSELDVVVMGAHPSALFAAALLGQAGKLKVLHVTPPAVEKPPDRFVWINPAVWELSPLLSSLRTELPVNWSFGVQFLSPDLAVRSRFQSKSPVAGVVRYGVLQRAMASLLKQAGVRCVSPKQLNISELDERGIVLQLGKVSTRAKLLILSDGCPDTDRPMLGLHDGWGTDVQHRYSSIQCPASVLEPRDGPPLLHMSLNTDNAHHWAWLWPAGDEVQLTVEEPAETATTDSGGRLLNQWIAQLRAAGVFSARAVVPVENRVELPLPTGGALVEEAVANRTLLIGPAGGFVSACGEEVYPSFWSAVFAEKVTRKAIRDRHPQDALHPYRQVWRTTLGEYLRGPRENLPFLLSMVYKNAMLTDRLGEAILMGKPLVR